MQERTSRLSRRLEGFDGVAQFDRKYRDGG